VHSSGRSHSSVPPRLLCCAALEGEVAALQREAAAATEAAEEAERALTDRRAASAAADADIKQTAADRASAEERVTGLAKDIRRLETR